MSFLYPAMLAGLAGLAVPVILHLIARHKFPVRDFPSVRLLREERRTNVFAWRLVDPLQLLLRLLVLRLLALAMARLFMPSFPSKAAPRNLVVVLDASASMFLATNDVAGGTAGTPIETARPRGIRTGLLAGRRVLNRMESQVEEPGLQYVPQPDRLDLIEHGVDLAHLPGRLLLAREPEEKLGIPLVPALERHDRVGFRGVVEQAVALAARAFPSSVEHSHQLADVGETQLDGDLLLPVERGVLAFRPCRACRLLGGDLQEEAAAAVARIAVEPQFEAGCRA
jgi:hypothetical protein